MTEDITRQSVLFPDLFRRPVVVKFGQRHGSSDGGAILMKACDERLGLTERLAGSISDGRKAGKVEHSARDLARQRVFGIACGYAKEMTAPAQERTLEVCVKQRLVDALLGLITGKTATHCPLAYFLQVVAQWIQDKLGPQIRHDSGGHAKEDPGSRQLQSTDSFDNATESQ